MHSKESRRVLSKQASIHACKQARKHASKQGSKQASRQSLRRHSVGAVTFRCLFIHHTTCSLHMRTIAILIPVSKISFITADLLESHLRIVPSQSLRHLSIIFIDTIACPVSESDLELCILEIKVCGVSVHVGVTILLTQARVCGTVPGCQLLAAEIIWLRM